MTDFSGLDDGVLDKAWWGIVAAISVGDGTAADRALAVWNERCAALGWTEERAGFTLAVATADCIAGYADALRTPIEGIEFFDGNGEAVDPDTLTGEKRGVVLGMRAIAAAAAGDLDIAVQWLAAASDDEVTGAIGALNRTLITIIRQAVAVGGPVPASWHLPA